MTAPPDRPDRLRVMRIIARMNVGGPALQVTGLTEGLDATRFDHRLYVGRVGPDEADYVELRAPDLPLRRVEGLRPLPRGAERRPRAGHPGVRASH